MFLIVLPFLFFFRKSQRRRGRKAQQEEPAAEPVRRRKSMDMILILLHYLSLYKRLAGRLKSAQKIWGVLIRNSGLSGGAVLPKDLHEQGQEKETKAYINSINSPRQWFACRLGKGNSSALLNWRCSASRTQAH